ncbi:MAG: hypothetical protein H0T97_07895 [Actinobacteria bacterium]|nr:hypothetical protein [Actinomycetota bacterium]
MAVGPFWADQPQQVEIDAVALAGRDREAVLVGESKWATSEDAGRLSRVLAAKAQALPNRAPDIRSSFGRPSGPAGASVRTLGLTGLSLP